MYFAELHARVCVTVMAGAVPTQFKWVLHCGDGGSQCGQLRQSTECPRPHTPNSIAIYLWLWELWLLLDFWPRPMYLSSSGYFFFFLNPSCRFWCEMSWNHHLPWKWDVFDSSKLLLSIFLPIRNILSVISRVMPIIHKLHSRPRMWQHWRSVCVLSRWWVAVQCGGWSDVTRELLESDSVWVTQWQHSIRSDGGTVCGTAGTMQQQVRSANMPSVFTLLHSRLCHL